MQQEQLKTPGRFFLSAILATVLASFIAVGSAHAFTLSEAESNEAGHYYFGSVASSGALLVKYNETTTEDMYAQSFGNGAIDSVLEIPAAWGEASLEGKSISGFQIKAKNSYIKTLIYPRCIASSV